MADCFDIEMRCTFTSSYPHLCAVLGVIRKEIDMFLHVDFLCLIQLSLMVIIHFLKLSEKNT